MVKRIDILAHQMAEVQNHLKKKDNFASALGQSDQSRLNAQSPLSTATSLLTVQSAIETHQRQIETIETKHRHLSDLIDKIQMNMSYGMQQGLPSKSFKELYTS